MRLIDSIIRQPARIAFGTSTASSSTGTVGLDSTRDASSVTVSADDGSFVVVPGASETTAGAMTAAEHAALGKAAGAQQRSLQDVEATNLPAALAFLHTAGHAAPGDGGGGLYRKVASEPAHPGKVQSGDGAWWELVPFGGRINVRQLGARGDGATDDAAAIQNALTFSVSAIGVSEVYVPPGRYIMDSRATVALTHQENLTICGAGRYNSWIVGGAANSSGLIQVTSAVRNAPVEVRDLGFEPGRDGAGTAFEYAGTAGGVQTKRILTMYRCDFGPRDHATALSFNDPIKATGLYRPMIFDVKCWPGNSATTKQGKVIDLSNCYAFHVQNCYLNGAATNGLYSNGTTEEAGFVMGNIINGPDRGVEIRRADNEPLFYILDNHINAPECGVYFDGVKYLTIRNNTFYATSAAAATTPTDILIVSGNGVQIHENVYRDSGSASDRRHVDLRGSSGTTEDIWIKEKALHASSDIAPFSIGAGVDRVLLEIPDNMPDTDFASYTAAQPYSVDPTATNVTIRTETSIISADAGAAAGPAFGLFRDSASPAASNALGTVHWYGKDDVGNKTGYALARAVIADPTSGSEEAALQFFTRDGGTLVNTVQMQNRGLAVGGLTPPAGNGVVLANSDGYYIQRYGSAQQVIAYNGPVFQPFTAANIADAAHSVNAAGKVPGLTVRDITNNRLMMARGPGPTDQWDAVDGSASVMPS